MKTMIVMMAAAELGISTRTLSRWADQGKIKAGRTAAGWRTFDPRAVVALKRKMEKRQAARLESGVRG